MLKTSKGWWATALVGGLLLSGCDRNQDASHTTLGEKIDNAANTVEQKADRAADKVEAAADKVENKMENAADRMEARTEQAGDAVSDAATTGKVKTALLAATALAAFQINVDTKDKVVTLTGSVDKIETAQQALTVARGVDGVTAVVDNITVTPRS